MNKMIIVLIGGICFSSCVSASGLEEDKYVGLTIEKVIEHLGEPDWRVERVIDNKYGPHEGEPFYPEYFSESELEKTIIINVASWKKRRKIITVWLRLVNDKWTVFSSVARPSSIVF